MATKSANRKKSTKSKSDQRTELINRYKEYVLIHRDPPASVYQFMHELKKEEGTFYQYFPSFEALEKQIWKSYAEVTVSALEKDGAYSDYSAREKLLAFYYTLFELLLQDRSYIRYSFDRIRRSEIVPARLKMFRERFMEYVVLVLNEGREQEEIIDRPVISERYQDGIWLQMMFLLRFWLKDDSEDFTGTDAAIEKSVNLSFELMGKGPLDQLVDFAKFLFHNR